MKTELSADKGVEYEFFGTYTNPDAKALLDAFVTSKIRFDIKEDSEKIKTMDAFTAANGGTFGQGVGIAIYTHPDDTPAGMEIRNRIFNLQADIDLPPPSLDDFSAGSDDLASLRCPKCSSEYIQYCSVINQGVLNSLTSFFSEADSSKSRYYCTQCRHTWA